MRSNYDEHNMMKTINRMDKLTTGEEWIPGLSSEEMELLERVNSQIDDASYCINYQDYNAIEQMYNRLVLKLNLV